MPSTVNTREIAELFGSFDSDALIDGTPASSALLRAMAMAAHRLLVKRETLIAECWDVTDPGGEVVAPSGLAWPFWVEVASWPLAKMRKRARYDVSIGVNAPTDAEIAFQLCTRKRPWVPNPDPASPHYVAVTGSGGYQAVLAEGLEGMDGHEDELTLFVRGDVSSDLGDEGTYGAPNTGTMTIQGLNELRPSGATTWNTSGDTWAYQHVVVYLDGGGRQIVEPRLIVGVVEDASGQYLQVWPSIDFATAQRLNGSTFEIRQLPIWRLSHLTAVTQERPLP